MSVCNGARWLARALIVAAITRAAAPVAASDAPPPIWSGAYVGLHAGHAWGRLTYTFDSFIGPEAFDHRPHDWFGGAHIGMQQQWGSVVAGLEAGYAALHLTDTQESKLLANRFRQVDIESLFTVVARLGLASGPSLAYVKGGFASAAVGTQVFIGGGSTTTATSGREIGWTFGAGWEFLCGRGLVLGLEYNYVNLGLSDRNGHFPDLKPFTYSGPDSDLHTLVARLSYKFGEPARHQPLK